MRLSLSLLLINAIVVFFIMVSLDSVFAQNVGINTTTPDASALLELESSDMGFLPPRLTTAQRDAILSPATGLIIYNLTENCINYYDGVLWLSLCGYSEISEVTIDVQPANASGCEGANVSFSISTTGGISYQWQVYSGSNWQNIESAGVNPVYSGYNSSTLQLTGITAINNGYLYRCVVSGDTPPPVVSNSVSLTILPLPSQPSAISGPVTVCPSVSITTTQEFNSDVLVHGSSAPTNVWFAPNYDTPIDYLASGGCTGGRAGYSGSWNDYWGNFVRLPEANCTGNDVVSLSFDVSHSYFAAHVNDWCRFYVWADGAYAHNVQSVTINGADVTYNSGINGKGFKFTETRSCAKVVVTFDISAISNKSNILFYLEPSCGYNNSNVYFVWFDNISLTTTGEADYDYSVLNTGDSYTWTLPSGWIFNSGQGTNSVNVSPGVTGGDVIVTPSNACGDGPSQSVNVAVCP